MSVLRVSELDFYGVSEQATPNTALRSCSEVRSWFSASVAGVMLLIV